MTDGAGPLVAVLGYHKIGAPSDGSAPSWWYVSEETFDRHLDVLDRAGWRCIDLATLLVGLDRPDALPPRAALVTFDDAYQLLCRHALPLLSRRGLPAVVFVPTGWVGGYNQFDIGIEPPEPICSWADLAALQQAGLSIQSHGVWHAAFPKLGEAERSAELGESRAELMRHTGAAVDAFAYPYGEDGPDPARAAREVQAAGYRLAFGYGGTTFRPQSVDRYHIPRLAVGPDSELAELLAAAPSGQADYE